MKAVLSRPVVFTVAGLVMAVVGFILNIAWGSVNAIQAATSPQEFAQLAHDQGNGVRWASWADILLIVPGYALFFIGLLTILKGKAPNPRLARVQAIGMALVPAVFIADQLENLTLQLGLGTVDLDPPESTGVVDPTGWLISALQVTYWLKWVLFSLTIVVIAVVAVLRFLDRREQPNPTPNRRGR